MKTRTRFVIIIGCLMLIPFLAQSFTASGNQQDDKPTAITRWEHLALPYHTRLDKELSTKINQLGNEGWQLVSVSTIARDGTTERSIYYFKRPK